MLTRRTLTTFKVIEHNQNDFIQSSKRQYKTIRRAAIHQEQYRTIQKQIPKLRNNTPPVCRNKRSYELIIQRTAYQTPEKCFTNAKSAVKYQMITEI